MNIRNLIALACVFGAIQSSQAQNSNYMIDGVDTTPLVEALNTQVTTLKKPIKVYHWFNADPNSKWAEQYSANDPRGFEFVKFASQKYWNEYGNKTSDVYGAGLYTAVDPVATQDYGGPNWVLVQIELPVGARMLDLQMAAPVTPQAIQTMKAIDCQNVAPTVDSFFSAAKTASDKCKANLKIVLNSFVHVEVIMYFYRATKFEGCNYGLRSKAAIVLDTSRFRPENVQIFNSKTKDANNERTIVQSLFYKASSDATTNQESFLMSHFSWTYADREIKNLYPGFNLSTIGYTNKTATICLTPSKDLHSDCKIVPLPLPDSKGYAKVISSNEIPFISYDFFGGLLWKDLDGKPTDPEIDEWIANNLYKCGK